MTNGFILDDTVEDGIERATFEHAIDHVITKRFGWSQEVAEVVKNEYTDWTKTNDPVENRNQYVHVSAKTVPAPYKLHIFPVSFLTYIIT